jgi:hypothetical protein
VKHAPAAVASIAHARTAAANARGNPRDSAAGGWQTRRRTLTVRRPRRVVSPRGRARRARRARPRPERSRAGDRAVRH